MTYETKKDKLRKIFETEKILTIDCFLKYLNRLKDFAEVKNFEMEQGESFVVDIKEHPIAALTLIRTCEDNYRVEFDYMDQTIILSQEFKDESFSNNTKLVAIKKAEEFIKSLDEQKDTEAGKAEINVIRKAISMCYGNSDLPEYAKWVCIDPDGKLWFFDKKPEINKFFNDTWTSRESGYCPMHFYTLDSMEGIDWRKSCVSIDEILQKSSYTKLAETTETIGTLIERLNKQEEVIIGLLRFMYDKKFLFDKVSDTRSCGALFEKCDEYLKKLGSTPYEYQKRPSLKGNKNNGR